MAESHSNQDFFEGISDPYRRLVETAADYAIFLLDRSGHIMSWNTGAQKIKGYAPADILGRHFSIFYDEEAKGRKWPERELTMAAAHGRIEDEGWLLRKDGTKFWAS